MNPSEFLGETGVIIVAGKGGVGKTTVSGALAVAASAAGLKTLIVDLDGKEGLGAMFSKGALDYSEQVLVEPSKNHAGVSARTLTPDDALIDYLAGRGLQRISNRLISTGLLDIVSTAVPGIRDILVLGKVKQLEQAGDQDLLILDAPAAGHAITFLRSASGLADAVKVGPINSQAQDVLELLADHDRCQVILVTIPEETPVNEMIETAYSLEEDIGVSLGPVVVNGIFPELAGLKTDLKTAVRDAKIKLLPGEGDLLKEAAEFRRSRQSVQGEQLDRLAESLPLQQLRLPYLFTSEMGRSEIDQLAHSLSDALLAQGDGTKP